MFATTHGFGLRAILSSLMLLRLMGAVHAQALIWRPKDDQGSYRCIYGEITVLATAPKTYYCGCNWWPSCPAGGYTGIQDLGAKHAMIFSIWDTSAEMHTVAVDQGDPRTELSRFGGEGEGGKSMLAYNWRLGQTYRYFVFKRQDEEHKCTLASTFFYDDELGRWVYEATIASPDNGDKCIKGFGGMMNAFLENFGGQDKDVPRLAAYRLWVGTTPDNLTCVTEANGNGHGMWGVVNDSFFLASGDEATVRGLVNGGQTSSGEPVWGAAARLQVSDTKISREIVKALNRALGILQK